MPRATLTSWIDIARRRRSHRRKTERERQRVRVGPADARSAAGRGRADRSSAQTWVSGTAWRRVRIGVGRERRSSGRSPPRRSARRRLRGAAPGRRSRRPAAVAAGGSLGFGGRLVPLSADGSAARIGTARVEPSSISVGVRRARAAGSTPGRPTCRSESRAGRGWTVDRRDRRTGSKTSYRRCGSCSQVVVLQRIDGEPGTCFGDELDVAQDRASNVASVASAHPRPGVAALVQRVVDQPRVTAHGDALPRRVEIGLGRDRVLVVAQVVADVGEQLDERDAEVRDVALAASPASRSARRSRISCRKLA